MSKRTLDKFLAEPANIAIIVLSGLLVGILLLVLIANSNVGGYQENLATKELDGVRQRLMNLGAQQQCLSGDIESNVPRATAYFNLAQDKEAALGTIRESLLGTDYFIGDTPVKSIPGVYESSKDDLFIDIAKSQSQYPEFPGVKQLWVRVYEGPTLINCGQDTMTLTSNENQTAFEIEARLPAQK